MSAVNNPFYANKNFVTFDLLRKQLQINIALGLSELKRRPTEDF